jgi:hypothetical protein
VTEQTVAHVAAEATEFLQTHSVPGTVLVLEADRTGLVVL